MLIERKWDAFFSFPPLTEMFHFSGFTSLPYEFRQWCPDLSSGQVAPFGNPRIKGCLPPPRGLSQATTSFVVFWCQGIHHTPFCLTTRIVKTYILQFSPSNFSSWRKRRIKEGFITLSLSQRERRRGILGVQDALLFNFQWTALVTSSYESTKRLRKIRNWFAPFSKGRIKEGDIFVLFVNFS